MKNIIKIIFIVFLAFNLFLASWYVLHSDIDFSSDIARDFFLLREIKEKSVILIGPRSSTGLFHGPLWLYLNYPAFAIGHGNPIVVGWWWIVLSSIFIGSSFAIAKHIFSTRVAYAYTIMVSIYTAFISYRYFNPHGAMFLIPLLYYLLIRYLQSKHTKYLIWLLLVNGAIIQFQMAVGIPLFLLTAFIVLGVSVRYRLLHHVLILPLIVLPLLNFIVFDIRHDHILTNQLMHFLASPSRDHPNYIAMLLERFRLAIIAPEILRSDPGNRNAILMIVMGTVTWIEIRKHHFVTEYLLFWYLYIGFFLLSIINTGPLLYFYLFPLFPLVFLLFSSLLESSQKTWFIVLFSIICVANQWNVLTDIKESNGIIGHSMYSWKFLHTLASDVFSRTNGAFGYFVYAPDVVAFEGKYAMIYISETYPAPRASYFQKADTTIIVAAPPPRNNPYMLHEWWVKNLLHISAPPVTVTHLDNGYTVETYHLSPEEILIPTEPNIDPGIAFR